jgi:quercetin dioxygenase-like cupin family protein
MEIIKKELISKDNLPGRQLQRAVGENSAFLSDQMTVGFARYSEDSGIMSPHNHAEETVIIFDVKDGSIEWGATENNLSNKANLEKGDVIHIPENEWHVFKYKPGGYVEIVFIYGSTKNLRPEDKK